MWTAIVPLVVHLDSTSLFSENGSRSENMNVSFCHVLPIRFWQASDKLEYLNIAFSNFDDFKALHKMTKLSTLVTSESVNIPNKDLKRLKKRGINVVFKEKAKR